MVLLKLANAGTVDIPHMKLTTFVNESSTGYYREVWGDKELFRVPTAWHQDDVNKRAKGDRGVPGQDSWKSSVYYFADKTYKLGPKDGKISCTLIPDFTYAHLNHYYGPQYLSYVGRHVLQEFGGKVADVYAGPVMDIEGPGDRVLYVSPTDGSFMGLIGMGSLQSKLSFWETWALSNSPSIPDNSVFELPHECDHPDTTENFWDKWNQDGTPKLPPN